MFSRWPVAGFDASLIPDGVDTDWNSCLHLGPINQGSWRRGIPLSPQSLLLSASRSAKATRPARMQRKGRERSQPKHRRVRYTNREIRPPLPSPTSTCPIFQNSPRDRPTDTPAQGRCSSKWPNAKNMTSNNVYGDVKTLVAINIRMPTSALIFNQLLRWVANFINLKS